MKVVSVHAGCLAVLCCISAFLAEILEPVAFSSNQQSVVNLSEAIPESFAGWSVDSSVLPVHVDPATATQLNNIYSQTVSRTYVDGSGNKVMLSIALGGGQTQELQVHRPEVCYAAQGFEVTRGQKATLHLKDLDIPVMQLIAHLGSRHEPITYWVRIGGKLVRGNLEQGIARLGGGLSGRVPDGLLMRVSTISSSPDQAFATQERFIGDLLSSISTQSKELLLGSSV